MQTLRSPETSVPVHPLVADRWSPRGFDESYVLTRDDLVPLLEAARWAPSAGNTQPTRWVVTLRGEPSHRRLLSCLSEGNRPWTPRASALLVAVTLTANEKGPLPMAAHDTGQAVAWLSVQAHAEGLHVHQMAGFDPDCLAQVFGLNPVQRPAVVVAVGRPGGSPLPERLAAREQQPRTRLPLAELVLDVA